MTSYRFPQKSVINIWLTNAKLVPAQTTYMLSSFTDPLQSLSQCFSQHIHKKSIPAFQTQGQGTSLDIYCNWVSLEKKGIYDDRKMLQIDYFILLITGFYNFQLITHDKPTKNIQCHSNYFSLLEVLDVLESSVLPSLITDIAKYMALGLPGKLSDKKRTYACFFKSSSW